MLRIGSRGSKLALWQANWIAERLRDLGESVEIEVIKTTGDKVSGLALSQIGTKGLFTKEIEEALLEGRIDLAVHSLKDMPTDLPDGLRLCAVPKREDPRDVMVGGTLDGLPRGARLGTSSLRRAAQARLLRTDLQVESIRGNLDTRLRKLDEGQYDAIVLAAAGLKRLGFEHRAAEWLPVDRMVPAVGQGALAVETRDESSPATHLCAALHDEHSGLAVTAERALLAALGGGCQVPIGAHARLVDGLLHLEAVVISPDGRHPVRRHDSAPPEQAAALGARLGESLLASGADEILEQVYGT